MENYCLRTAKCSKVYEVARYKIGRIDYKGSEEQGRGMLESGEKMFCYQKRKLAVNEFK